MAKPACFLHTYRPNRTWTIETECRSAEVAFDRMARKSGQVEPVYNVKLDRERPPSSRVYLKDLPLKNIPAAPIRAQAGERAGGSLHPFSPKPAASQPESLHPAPLGSPVAPVACAAVGYSPERPGFDLPVAQSWRSFAAQEALKGLFCAS